MLSKAVIYPIKDCYFDLESLSAYSCLSVPCLRDYLKAGEIPGFKVKGKILVKKSEFDEWLKGYRLNRKQDLSGLVDDVMKDIRQ